MRSRYEGRALRRGSDGPLEPSSVRAERGRRWARAARELRATALAGSGPGQGAPGGFLGDAPSPFTETFRQALRELGYVEGEILALEWRWVGFANRDLGDLDASRPSWSAS